MSSDVILTRAVRECGLRAGGVGTIVEHHIVPGTTEEVVAPTQNREGFAARRILKPRLP
jgi:hypothetical protein